MNSIERLKELVAAGANVHAAQQRKNIMPSNRFTVLNAGQQAGGMWGVYDANGGSSPILLAYDRETADATAHLLNEYPDMYDGEKQDAK